MSEEAVDKAVDILETVVSDLTHQNEELIHQNERLCKQNDHLVHENEELVVENTLLVRKQRFEPVFKAFGAFRFLGTGVLWLLKLCGLIV